MAMNSFINTVDMTREYEKKKSLEVICDPQPTASTKKKIHENFYHLYLQLLA
jgi:hypothetical protein